MVLGHEGSGKILEIGEGVKNVRVGQRVSFEPGYPVEDDDFTKQGKRGMKKIKAILILTLTNGLCEGKMQLNRLFLLHY